MQRHIAVRKKKNKYIRDTYGNCGVRAVKCLIQISQTKKKKTKTKRGAKNCYLPMPTQNEGASSIQYILRHQPDLLI